MKNKFTFKKLRRIILEFFFLILLVWGIGKWQTRNLIANGVKLINFKLTALDGQVINSGLINKKKTLLYFFAPWCSVCKLNISNLNDLQESNKYNIYAIALSYKNIKQLKTFKAKYNLKVPVIPGNPALAKHYKISAFPTIYYINTQGVIKYKSVGYTTSIGMQLRML